jgi:hypothetical protein
MSTRAHIAIYTAPTDDDLAQPGIVRKGLLIYCHSDGYPSWVGAKLEEHYRTAASAAALMDLGDLSALGDTTRASIAYHRDRGEPKHDAAAKVWNATIEHQCQDSADYGMDWLYVANLTTMDTKPANVHRWTAFPLTEPMRHLGRMSVHAAIAMEAITRAAGWRAMRPVAVEGR